MQSDASYWLNKLAKWRSFFAGWQLGTRSDTDPECAAVKDHREATLIQRVEVTAIVGLLIKKGILTAEEFTDASVEEAKLLDADFERRFDGYSTSMSGLHMDIPRAAETARKMHFKP